MNHGQTMIITDAELGLEYYVMFRKDIMGTRGGGVLLSEPGSIPLRNWNVLSVPIPELELNWNCHHWNWNYHHWNRN